MTIRTRRITVPDDDLRRLIGELDAELSGLTPPEQRHGISLDAIFAPHIRFFIAHEADRARGCGGVALFADFAEVKRMYVRPAARGKGVADAIMDALITETAAAGLSCLRLETGTNFDRALGFYTRWGFTPCAIFEPYAAKPAHTVASSAFLERRLA